MRSQEIDHECGSLPADGIVQAHFTFLEELQNGYRREQLIDRPDCEAGIQSIGKVMLTVREAIGSLKYRLAVFCDQDGPGKSAAAADRRSWARNSAISF